MWLCHPPCAIELVGSQLAQINHWVRSWWSRSQRRRWKSSSPMVRPGSLPEMVCGKEEVLLWNRWNQGSLPLVVSLLRKGFSHSQILAKVAELEVIRWSDDPMLPRVWFCTFCFLNMELVAAEKSFNQSQVPTKNEYEWIYTSGLAKGLNFFPSDWGLLKWLQLSERMARFDRNCPPVTCGDAHGHRHPRCCAEGKEVWVLGFISEYLW